MNDHDISFDEFDEINNPRPEECEFDRVVESAISRRGFLGVVAMGTASFLTSTSILSGRADAAADRFGFAQIAANGDDAITVPEGFFRLGRHLHQVDVHVQQSRVSPGTSNRYFPASSPRHAPLMPSRAGRGAAW